MQVSPACNVRHLTVLARRLLQQPWGGAQSSEGVVLLIIYYVAFMIVGDLAAYLIGLLAEREWGSQVSLIAFLSLYFLLLWVSWILAVWITDPRRVTKAAL